MSLYLAGLFRRFVANIMDWVLLLVVLLVVPSLVAAPLLGNPLTQGMASLIVLGAWVAAVIFYAWLYAHGTTFGKASMGVRVIRANGEFPGFWTMLLRETVGKVLSGLFFGLGWFWAIWDRDRQAWHDKIAGTVVVHRKD